MIATLRARMMLMVSLLAIGAVIAVALAARHNTRHEFRRYQEIEQLATKAAPPTTLETLASSLLIIRLVQQATTACGQLLGTAPRSCALLKQSDS